MFDDNLFLNDPLTTLQLDSFFLRPDIFNSLPDQDKLFLWRRARAVTIWNQRAALLKAVSLGLTGTALSEAERDIQLINNWFAGQYYNSNIDAATGQSVTPLIDAARLASLADQNRQAAQDIAASAVAPDLVRIGTDLANIARQNIGGSMRAATGRMMRAAGAGLLPGGAPGTPPEEGSSSRLILLGVAGAALAAAALAVARALESEGE